MSDFKTMLEQGTILTKEQIDNICELNARRESGDISPSMALRVYKYMGNRYHTMPDDEFSDIVLYVMVDMVLNPSNPSANLEDVRKAIVKKTPNV